MSNVWINVLTGILLVATLFVSEQINETNRWRFKLMIIFSIATFVLGWWKDYRNDISQKEDKKISDSLTRLEIWKHDSLFQARSDTSVSKVVKAFGKAVGEYNLKVESGINGVVKIVRDSAKRIINQINDVDPYFGVCLPEQEHEFNSLSIRNVGGNEYIIYANFCTEYASAVDIDLKQVFISKAFVNYDIINGGRAVLKGAQNPLGILIHKRTRVRLYNYEDKVFVFYYGTYKNSMRTKKIYGQ